MAVFANPSLLISSLNISFSLIHLSASLKKFFLISKPYAFRLSSNAAIKVEPLPAQGSITISPSSVKISISFLHLCILFIENIHHNICGEIMFFFKKKQQLYNNLIKSHGIGY